MPAATAKGRRTVAATVRASPNPPACKNGAETDTRPGAGAAVFNPPSLMRWNLDKRYLIDLAERGISLPETRVVAGDLAMVQAAIARMGSGPIVVKPSIGQSGHGVDIVDQTTVLAAVARAGGRPLILQRYVPEVRECGEVSCVFFDGQFAHAFLKRPAPGEYRVNSQYHGQVEAIDLPAGIVAQAAAVVQVLPEVPLYARVDGVLRDQEFLLMELELIEPGLGLNLATGAAARFADATLRRLHQLV